MPAEGETFTFDSTAGKVRIVWDGVPEADHLVEVQLGDGDAQFTTQVEVTGLELEREFSKQYWEEYVKRYNPARFRVKVDGDVHEWSPWRTVSVQ